MDEARERARAVAPDGTVVVAQRMTAGRGQHGNVWHAPEGGLYLSLIVRDLHDPHLLTLALGNAIADTLEIAGVEPWLKWVNDVFVADRKIAGVLVEGEATGDRFEFLIAGIGVNLNGGTGAWPAGLAAAATTLEQELACDTCIPDFETALLDQVAFWIAAVRAGRDHEILAAWRRRDWLRGRRVKVGDVAGEAQGVDARGRLLVAGQPVMTGPVEVLG
jgi:BirA family biotin operon repressor/biotin-[acetyl-CoA-carboxylase] ligase